MNLAGHRVRKLFRALVTVHPAADVTDVSGCRDGVATSWCCCGRCKWQLYKWCMAGFNGAELSGCIHCESTPQVVLVMLMLAAVEMV